MHSLEIIIARNAHAAGREEAHAVNDGEAWRETPDPCGNRRGSKPERGIREWTRDVIASAAYFAGYRQGRTEG